MIASQESQNSKVIGFDDFRTLGDSRRLDLEGMMSCLLWLGDWPGLSAFAPTRLWSLPVGPLLRFAPCGPLDHLHLSSGTERRAQR